MPAAPYDAAGVALAEARYVFERLSAAKIDGDIITLPPDIAADPKLSGIVKEQNKSAAEGDSEAPSVGNSPTVSASVFGVPGRALADTGAEVNLICVQFLLSALRKANINPLTAGYSSSPPKVSAANGQELRLFGTITLPVSVSSQTTVRIKFSVTKDPFGFDYIFGTPGLQSLGYYLANGITGETISFVPKEVEKPTNDRVLRVFRAVSIPPLTAKFLSAYVTDTALLNKTLLADNMAANDLPNANTDMDLDELLEGGVEEVSNAKVSSASLRIEPCLQATSHGRLSVLVMNYSGIQQELKQGDLIGEVEEVTDVCSAENALSSPILTNWLERTCRENDARLADACVRTISDRHAELLAVIKAKMGKLTAEQKTDIDALVLEFHDIFALTESELTQTNLVMHGIETIDERPISTRVRQIPYALREKFAAMLKDFLARGLISPSTSPYASPVVLVAKKEKDSIRMCVD